MKVINGFYSILVPLIILVACRPKDAVKEETTSKSNEIQEEYVDEVFVKKEDESILSYTDSLYLGDTLKLRFKTPHPKDFAITTPSGKYFFIVYKFSDTLKPSLYDWDQFEMIDFVEIITDQTKANLYDARVYENRLIFTETGRYEIRMSENLETDDGTPMELHYLNFVNEKRKE